MMPEDNFHLLGDCFLLPPPRSPPLLLMLLTLLMLLLTLLLKRQPLMMYSLTPIPPKPMSSKNSSLKQLFDH
jgi:hypothetical protein